MARINMRYEKKPIAAPGDITSYPTDKLFAYLDARCIAEAGHIFHCDTVTSHVLQRNHAVGRLNVMSAGSDPAHGCEPHAPAHRPVTAQPQIADVVEEDTAS